MKIVKILPLVLLIAVFTFLCASGAQGKEESVKSHQIIRLHYSGGITPPEVTIKLGATVIWVNDSRAPVEIQFEGKQVTLACKSVTRFVIDENGSYISERIPQGSVASLCFMEEGEYSYVARKSSYGSRKSYRGIKEFKGKIIVK